MASAISRVSRSSIQLVLLIAIFFLLAPPPLDLKTVNASPPGTPAPAGTTAVAPAGIPDVHPARLDAVPRIVAGEDAHVAQFPYQLYLTIMTGEVPYKCGACLLDEQTALTAAHCIMHGALENYTVVAGERNRHVIEGSEQFAHPIQIRSHPQYNNSTFVNDIAILHFAEGTFQLNSYVQKIRIPRQNQVIYVNGMATASGWGRTSSDLPFRPSVLQTVQLPIIPNEECKRRYAGTNTVTDKMICAGGHVASTCKGDSGGPLVFENYQNEGPLLIGLTSWGVGCGNGHYGVYTKVSAYTDWIHASQNLARGNQVPLRVTINLDKTVFMTGSEVSIPCEVEGYPIPRVLWYHEEDAVPGSDPRARVLEDNTLVITNATTSDSGTYRVEVLNDYGVASATVNIQVEGAYLHPNCTDNPFFTNCKLIVKTSYCTNRYYSRFCCKSCTLAGQLPKYGPHLAEYGQGYYWGFIVVRGPDSAVLLTYKNVGNEDETYMWTIRSLHGRSIGVTVVDVDLTSGGRGEGSLTCQSGFSTDESTVPKLITSADKGQQISIPDIETMVVSRLKPGQSFHLRFTGVGEVEKTDQKETTRISLVPRHDGVLTQYSYPASRGSQYKANESRLHVLEGAPGKRIRLNMDSVHTELEYDWLKVYAFSVQENRFRLLEKLTGELGSLSGKTFYGNEGQPMLIYFESDASVQKYGFTFSYTYEAAIVSSGACGGLIQLPNQSRLTYRNTMTTSSEEICVWFLWARNTGPIQYNWKDSSTTSSSSAKLNVQYLNEDSWAWAIGPSGVNQYINGSLTTLTYRSTVGQGFTMDLNSLGLTDAHKGWKIDTIFLEPQVGSGTVFSYPINRGVEYAAYEWLNIHLRSSPGKKIRLTLTYLNTEANHDFLIIYQFSSQQNKFLHRHKLSGNKGSVNTIVDAGPNEPIQLNFISDGSVQGDGFTISYQYM